MTVGAVRCAKFQSNCHQQQANTQFLQAGCRSCSPTNSIRALKGKVSHSTYLLTASSRGGGVFQLCLCPPKVLGNSGEGCQTSHQPSDAEVSKKTRAKHKT